MKEVMVMLAASLLAACASTDMPDASRLDMLQANAGPPLKQVRYTEPMGWDRVDGRHVLLDMRPRETLLLTLNGPCLEWDMGSPLLAVRSQTGFLLDKFDSVQVVGSQVRCQIDEIRLVDMQAVRAAEKQLRDQGASGT